MKRATITYNRQDAQAKGEPRHPGAVMRLLAHQNRFRVVEANERVLETIWEFEVEGQDVRAEQFPSWCAARLHR